MKKSSQMLGDNSKSQAKPPAPPKQLLRFPKQLLNFQWWGRRFRLPRPLAGECFLAPGNAISRSRLPLAAILALALAPLACNQNHKVTVKETFEEAPGKAALPVTINMGDPKEEKQLVSGFYGIEANAWRWTGKNFAVSLRPPTGSAAQGATLDFALSIPQVTIDKLKSVTLSASVNGTKLAPETYSHEGQYDYKRDVPSNLITGSAVRVEFNLDKAMPPSGGDARELGIVARSVGLESK